jgi:hypothetical protein
MDSVGEGHRGGARAPSSPRPPHLASNMIILAPNIPKSGRLMMGRISRGPTPTTSKARPSSFSLGIAVRPPTAEPPPTQASTLATSTGGSTSHDLRPLPSYSIGHPPGGRLQRGGSSPAPRGTCSCGGARGSTLSRGQAMMRFSPAWKADCPGIPSPGY